MSSYGGTPTPVHGPFDTEELGSGKKRRRLKNRIQRAIGNGKCGCEMCEERDRPVGMPDQEMWSRRPGEPGEVYIAEGPSMERAIGGQEPWDERRN